MEDVDGNRFLDFMAGIAVTLDRVHSPDGRRGDRRTRRASSSTSAAPISTTRPMADLCERLARLAPATEPKRVFLTNSGTEAVEGAIKLARHHTGRPHLVAFKGAFHGRTSARSRSRRARRGSTGAFGPFLPGVHHVPYANPLPLRIVATDARPASAASACARIEDELFARHLDPTEVAAIFVEPIQGEGGYVVPPRGVPRRRYASSATGTASCWWPTRCRAASGGPGRCWRSSTFGVEPDIAALARRGWRRGCRSAPSSRASGS